MSRKTRKQIQSSAAIISKSPFKLYLKIEGDLPQTPNAINSKGWRNKDNNARKWKQVVQMELEKHSLPPPLNRAHISVLVHTWQVRDYDGLVGSVKPVIDGLKGIVLVDDSWNHTGAWKVDQRFRLKKDGPKQLEVWVTELEESEGH